MLCDYLSKNLYDWGFLFPQFFNEFFISKEYYLQSVN